MTHNIEFSGKLLLIGAGRAGSILLRLFSEKPSIQVIGVVDINPEAPGIEIAKKLALPIAADYSSLLETGKPDLIVNVTGDSKLQDELLQRKAPRTELIGGTSAMLIWTILDEYKKKEILEDHFNIILRELESQSKTGFIFGKNPQMQEIASLIKNVAPTPTCVLIRGESGTGKEGIARLIHKNSHLHDKPLVTVNCTAFSPALIESELFGYKKGAFTGATSDRTGLLELADKGTIFLDEIGDMSLEMQTKLLRFLQSGEIRPVGSNSIRTVSVRVITATNRNLEDSIKNNEFRRDLFYRINTFTITLPTLAERREDIPLLVGHFMKLAEAKINKKVARISPAALSRLCGYDWPGNLRELGNVIERAIVLVERNTIEVEHLPAGLEPREPGAELNRTAMEKGLTELKTEMIKKFEYEAIYRYLSEHKGNITHAAKFAKISRRTFHRLLEKHKIKPENFKD